MHIYLYKSKYIDVQKEQTKIVQSLSSFCFDSIDTILLLIFCKNFDLRATNNAYLVSFAIQYK